jgi:hypothetical protein
MTDTPYGAAREDVARAMAQVLVPAVEWHDIPDLLKQLLNRCTDTALTAAAPHIKAASADLMRAHGWTCEYHEPTSQLGECKQCDTSHAKTADAIAATVCGGGEK